MIDIAKEFGYKIRSFHHAVEAYKIADLLATEGISASHLGRLVGLQDGGARRHQGERRARRTRAGARAIIHSDDPSGSQRLNQEAAKAMAAGAAVGIAIADDDAIKWITRQPGLGARHRRSHRHARSRQERRRRDLVGQSVQRLRARREGLHRRRAAVRSLRSGAAAGAPTSSSGFVPRGGEEAAPMTTAPCWRCAGRDRRARRRRAAAQTIAIYRRQGRIPVSRPPIENAHRRHRRRQDHRGRRERRRCPPAPSGSTRSGKWITPGLIDAATALGVRRDRRRAGRRTTRGAKGERAVAAALPRVGRAQPGVDAVGAGAQRRRHDRRRRADRRARSPGRRRSSTLVDGTSAADAAPQAGGDVRAAAGRHDARDRRRAARCCSGCASCSQDAKIYAREARGLRVGARRATLATTRAHLEALHAGGRAASCR